MSGIVGIDVGGAFTDLYFSGGRGRPHQILKLPSTPKDPSVGLLDALHGAGLQPDGLDALLTTIATNAVIERRGAHCALATTRGFRDILELGRRDRPETYGPEGTHEPLVPRDLRFEVDERVDHEGNVLKPLNEAGVRAVGELLKTLDVESVVIAYMHACANTAHEDRTREILASMSPQWELEHGVDIGRQEGTPQGGPLSPLLANVLLHEVNPELERREAQRLRSGFFMRLVEERARP